MRKLLLLIPLLLLCCLPIAAQTVEPAHSVPQPADCQIGPYTVTTTGRSPAFDNRVTPAATGLAAGCTNWTLIYFANGAATLSIELDEAPDSSGVAGSWVTWINADLGPQSGNPMTSLTGDQLTAFEYYPWVSINLTTLTGAGANVTYMALGYRPRFGVDASSVGGAASNQTFAITLPNVSSCGNGSVSCTPYSCTITLSTNTTTQCQAAPAAGLRNYVQNYQLYFTAAGTGTTVNVNYGTGANCGTGNTVLTPSYANTTATPVNTVGVLASLSGSGLVPPLVNAICVTQAGTTAGTAVVTVTGFIAP